MEREQREYPLDQVEHRFVGKTIASVDFDASNFAAFKFTDDTTIGIEAQCHGPYSMPALVAVCDEEPPSAHVLKEALQEILRVHANDNHRPRAFYIAAKALVKAEG